MDVQLITIKIIDKFTNTLLQVEELTQPKAPKLVYNGADDKYQPIMTAEFSFNMYVKDNADGKFFHLYTGNERRYYVTVETELGFVFYEGWLLPDFYSEPFTNSVMFVSLTSTDGLGGLKAHYLADSYYLGESNVVKLIAECLKKTGLQKKIYLAPSIMNAATDYLWHEIAVDGNSYLNGDIKYEGLFGSEMVLPSKKNCYDILELLCNDLGVTLFGWGDVWYLEGINRKHEENQDFYEYDTDGNYVGVISTVKNVVNVDNTFKKEPTVSIVSPWKRVEVEWEIDEDGNLVPEWAIKDTTTGNLIQNSFEKDMYDFWKSNGQIYLASFSRDLKSKYQLLSGWAFDLGYSVPPNNLYVHKRSYINGVSYGENGNDIENNFISIKNKKYLQVSDQWMQRFFTVEVLLNAGDKYSVSGIPVVSEGDYSQMLKYDFLTNDSKILSSKDGSTLIETKKFDCKYQMHSIQFSTGIQVGDYYEITADTVKSKLTADEVPLPTNGFFDIKLHAPISPNPAASLFYGYVVDSMSIKYTEEKKRITAMIRNIDFTTVRKVNCFHGDSIQDLSIKQFRLRRYIPMPDTFPGEVEFSSYFEGPVGSLGINAWSFVISATAAQNIINNYQLLNFSLPTPYGVLNLDELEQNPTNGNSTWQLRWNVFLENGVWILRVLPTPYMDSIGINLFGESICYIDTGSDPVYGWVFENNEWRESWKRWGESESKRYGECLGRVYHDVQPEPIVKIEGEIMKIISPRELLTFEWMYMRNFYSSRITMDFSEGTTSVLLLETKKQNITDYVN